MYFSVANFIEQVNFARKNGFVISKDNLQMSKSLIMRHDVDFDLACAREMAIIENSLGVNAVYCIMVSNPLYDVTSPSNIQYIQDLISLKHEIALHYDSVPHKNLDFEKQMELLEDVSRVKVKYFSQHQPTLQGFVSKSDTEGYISLYDKQFTEDRKYISDSCMFPREEYYEVIKFHKKVQYLVHPEFWILGASNLLDFGTKLKGLHSFELHKIIDDSVSVMQETIKNRKLLDAAADRNMRMS